MRWSTLTLATLVVLALFIWAACTAQLAPARAETPSWTESRSPATRLSPSAREPMVEAVIQVSNAERAKAGLPPLQPNDSLMQAAQEYAVALAPGTCFEHTCPPIPALQDRLARRAYGLKTPSCWMTSPSAESVPPRRRSQIMSQWTALSLVPPVSG